MKTITIIAAITILAFVSCLKEENYPLEPFIEFNGFTKVIIPPDSIPSKLILSIRFTDGDGDIGLTQNDTLPPYEYNFFMDVYKREAGELKLIFPSDTVPNFNGRIPVVVENPNNKPIKGTIEYAMNYGEFRFFFLSDTITFDVSLMDRALNRSNIIRTPEIIID